MEAVFKMIGTTGRGLDEGVPGFLRGEELEGGRRGTPWLVGVTGGGDFWRSMVWTSSSPRMSRNWKHAV